MEDLYQIFKGMCEPGNKVLATIIRVQGSAYKREGASMLFLEEGKQLGMLSAGCLETDLALRAKDVFENPRSIILHYDLQEEKDWGWGQGYGCNGKVDILLEYLTEKQQEDFLLAKDLLDHQLPVTIVKKLDETGEYLFFSKMGAPFGDWTGDFPDEQEDLSNGSMVGNSFFRYKYQPKPRLYVFGAGKDARPLVSLASDTGFSVTVCDWREELCCKEYFPNADRLEIGFPRKLFNHLSFSSHDFVVIMSHHFQRDQEIVNYLFKKNLRYLGVLGPRERTKRLLHGAEIPTEIFSPVGLNIGAKGPFEIAVSIVAEMIDVWRNHVQKSVEALWSIPE